MQEALQEPFELRKHRLSVTARMGVTCIDSGLQRAEEALREADIALSVSKRHDTASDRRLSCPRWAAMPRAS